MAVVKRVELPNKMANILTESGPRIFLFFGERFLCRKAVDELITALLQWKNSITHVIDGDQEDGSHTLAKLMSFSLLPGLQIYRINDTRLFHTKNTSQSIWQKAVLAFKANRLQQAAGYLADMYHIAAIPLGKRQPLTEMSNEQWQNFFGLAKPTDLAWTNACQKILEEQPAKSPTQPDLPEKYIENFTKGMPPNNIAIFTAENVDKRKRLYTFIKKHGLIVDCCVMTGGNAAAQKAQKSVLVEMMHNTLRQYNKKIEHGALEVFLERLGFHPVAVVIETEKLSLYAGDNKLITLKDVEEMVGRSREDALFELTDNIAEKHAGKALTTLHHLLENGIHGLAILATLRNYLRNLLIFRTFQLKPEPIYDKSMTARQFQEQYLTKLKLNTRWQDPLGGHPYALYLGFAKAAQYQCATLKYLLQQILVAEFRMKGSGLSERLILEHLVITISQEQAPD